MADIFPYFLAKGYTEDSLIGAGALKGKNATIQSITPIDGGNEVVFQWTLDDGTVQTQTMTVKDGEEGNGIAKIEQTTTSTENGGVNVVTITMTDGSTSTFEVRNGQGGTGGGTGSVSAAEIIPVTLAAAGWVDGSQAAKSEKFLAAGYFYMVKPDDPSVDAYTAAGIKSQDITVDGSMTFTATITPTVDLTATCVRFKEG